MNCFDIGIRSSNLSRRSHLKSILGNACGQRKGTGPRLAGRRQNRMGGICVGLQVLQKEADNTGLDRSKIAMVPRAGQELKIRVRMKNSVETPRLCLSQGGRRAILGRL